MKETKLVVFTKEKYMDNRPVVQLVHSTDYGIKTLKLWIDGGMSIGKDKVKDNEREIYLNNFGSDAARNKAINIWYGARHENARTPEPTRTLEDVEAELDKCKKIIRIMKEIIDGEEA